jgi:hypothetical protein
LRTTERHLRQGEAGIERKTRMPWLQVQIFKLFFGLNRTAITPSVAVAKSAAIGSLPECNLVLRGKNYFRRPPCWFFKTGSRLLDSPFSTCRVTFSSWVGHRPPE